MTWLFCVLAFASLMYSENAASGVVLAVAMEKVDDHGRPVIGPFSEQ